MRESGIGTSTVINFSLKLRKKRMKDKKPNRKTNRNSIKSVNISMKENGGKLGFKAIIEDDTLQKDKKIRGLLDNFTSTWSNWNITCKTRIISFVWIHW